MFPGTPAINYFKGTFHTPPEAIQAKLSKVRAYIFDWDGVFNNGHKNADGNSSFSETDSMGINLLRFNHYLRAKELPLSAVITGENNRSAFFFAKRENIDYTYYSFRNKMKALEHICERNDLQPAEVMFVFDDVLDLSSAAVTGIRMMVQRTCNPLLTDYVKTNNLADYITYHDGNNGAIRECCELIMYLGGEFDNTIACRIQYDGQYKSYLQERNRRMAQYYTLENDEITHQTI